MERDKVTLVIVGAIVLSIYKTYTVKKHMKTLDMKVDDVKKRLDIAIQIEVDRRFRTIVDKYED